MPSVMLSDAFVNSVRCVPKTGRIEWWDKREPGLALRVSANGFRSYIVVVRYPRHSQPTRRSIDRLVGPPENVEHAREIARQWRRQVKAGLDPRSEHAKQVAAAMSVATLGEVIDAFIAYKTKEGHASTKPTEQLLHREVPKAWLKRPVTDIRPDDIAKVINAIKARGHHGQAHAMLGTLRRLFSWAIGTLQFGIETSPAAAFRPGDAIGQKQPRKRVLNDSELKAVWQAAKQTDDPYGQIIQVLMLTGARLNMIAKLRWDWVDYDAGLISIPDDSMKTGEFFELPMTPRVVQILKSIERKRGRGPFVFSTTNGHRAFSGFSKAKKLLDEKCRVGKDEKTGKQDEKTAWVTHDIRRTARSKWSAIRNVSTETKEIAMAHALRGMIGTYDRHSYRTEKLDLLTQWERMLMEIVGEKIERRPMPVARAPQRERVRQVAMVAAE